MYVEIFNFQMLPFFAAVDAYRIEISLEKKINLPKCKLKSYVHCTYITGASIASKKWGGK